MQFTFIKLQTMLYTILSPFVHRSPIKTLCLLVYSALESARVNVSAWAQVLAVVKNQRLKNTKFIIQRFLHKSAFCIASAYQAITIYLLSKLPLDKKILVCMDWVDMGIFKVLVISLVIEGIGRTMPLYIKSIRIDMTDNEMTNFEKEALKIFFLSISDESIIRRIIILADRGFAKAELFKLIKYFHAHFIIRLPLRGDIFLDGFWVPLGITVKRAQTNRRLMKIYYTRKHSFILNIIIGHDESASEGQEQEKWVLATDGYFDVNTACKIYSLRMRIEEMFRDMKSYGFNCEQIYCTDEYTADKQLLVVAISYVVVILLWWEYADKKEEKLMLTIHNNKRGIDEHSEFAKAMGFYQACMRMEGITKEGLDFLWTYILIRTPHRKLINADFYRPPST